jgi:hypothetical protein
MTPAKLTVEITIPASGALDPGAICRSIAQDALRQALHAVGDPRLTTGKMTHNFGTGTGNEAIGTWTFTPPAV